MERGSSQMVQDFSRRAQQVVFLARFKAGQKGAKMIDVDHLLQAIVIQDQGAAEVKKFLDIDPADPIEWPGLESPSKSFFSREIASQLLTRLEALSPYSRPVPPSQDMPISSELAQTFGIAVDLHHQLRTKKVESLELLAAALGVQSSSAAKIFIEAGITQATVLEAIEDRK